jgi:hypothetical protein
MPSNPQTIAAGWAGPRAALIQIKQPARSLGFMSWALCWEKARE